VGRGAGHAAEPNDVAILIDRLLVSFEKPSAITPHQGITVTSQMSVESLSGFIEETRGRGAPSPMEASPLPRRRRLVD
jgi:hypothetical protein